MPIKAYITTADPAVSGSVRIEEQEILTTLGPGQENVAVQMQELFQTITESVTASLEVESQLTVKVSGTVNLKGEGGINYLFLNLGKAEASAAGTVEITLSTTLRPKFESKTDKSRKP